jgi:putative SOS response-associated peptidase YedK
MCNLYSVTKGQAAIIELTRAIRDKTGNLPPMPAVFPDYSAPIVRNAVDGVRELVLARWGMPGPPQFGGAPITNIRNTKSPHWRAWLKPENRCVVPFNSFCEYADTKPRKTPTWFALNNDRPLSFFAGIWTMAWQAWHQNQPRRRRAPTLWVSNNGCKCRSWGHSSQGDARYSNAYRSG